LLPSQDSILFFFGNVPLDLLNWIIFVDLVYQGLEHQIEPKLSYWASCVPNR
jgi:hypothetical protein